MNSAPPPKQHEFRIRFSSGEELKLTVDFSVCPPKFTATPNGLVCRFPSEYEAWLMSSVVPTVMNECSGEQAMALAETGQKPTRSV